MYTVEPQIKDREEDNISPRTLHKPTISQQSMCLKEDNLSTMDTVAGPKVSFI